MCVKKDRLQAVQRGQCIFDQPDTALMNGLRKHFTSYKIVANTRSKKTLALAVHLFKQQK